MNGSDLFKILMKKNGVAISEEQSIRLANFIAGMISVHEFIKKERDEALAKLAAMESQTPVAWMHNSRETDVISTAIKDLVHKSFTAHGFYSKVERAPVDKSENYTIPLYAKPEPADKQSALTLGDRCPSHESKGE